MRLLTLLLSAALLSLPALAQKNNLDSVRRIKTEAFDHSQVMDQMANLSDLYGPRLTASPEFEQAAQWAVSRLKEYGLSNVHTESWGPFGRSWSVESYTLDMIAPRYSHLAAAPLAWSAPSQGVQTGELLSAPMEPTTSIFNLNKNREAFHTYQAKWKGKLRGKIILVSEAQAPKPTTNPLFRRYTDAELTEIAQAPLPSAKQDIKVDDLKIPADEEEATKYIRSLPESMIDQVYDRYVALLEEEGRFFHDEGVTCILRSDRRAHNGLLFAEAAGSRLSKEPLAPPTFVVTEEQYSRLARLVAKKQPVSIRLSLNVKSSESDVDGKNIVGEIPGASKPDEVVMIGAHFDSWHTGTGATDNGAGSAVMIEVMRILKALNIPLNRTVRIGLWSGEEQGLFGSKAYVKEHFGNPATMELKPDHAHLDAYLNLDNGSGKIRGVYLQGNDAARPIFETALQPFHDMGASTLSLKNTGGTDHLSFDEVGLPGFQFIQDPLDYGTATHHSDLDTYSHIVPEDLMQASAIIATLVVDLANREELMPRKPVAK